MNNKPDEPKPAEPPPVPEREPQHEPGYEQRMKEQAEKEAGASDKKANKSETENKPTPRGHAAKAKQHIKHARLAPAKAKIRKHK